MSRVGRRLLVAVGRAVQFVLGIGAGLLIGAIDIAVAESVQDPTWHVIAWVLAIVVDIALIVLIGRGRERG